MTEPSVYVEDVSKLKDAGELKQAYVGLKDTNRYLSTAPSPPNLQVSTLVKEEFPLSTRPKRFYLPRALAVTLRSVCVCVCEHCLVLCRSPRFTRKPLEVSDLLSRLR